MKERALTIPERIKAVRKDRGLTQHAVSATMPNRSGDGVGRARSSASQWERGDKLPSVPTLLGLCAVLDCTPDDLLLGTREHLEAVETVNRALAEVARAVEGSSSAPAQK